MFPFALLLLIDHVPGFVLIALFATIAGARILLLDNLSGRQRLAATAIVLIFCLGAFIAARIDPDLSWLRSYPVLISLAIATWFATTLFQAEPATTRLARLAGMDVPAHRTRYMRVLTGIWMVFLLANAGISGYTAVAGSTSAWALYNGVISYVLMGLLFAGEYLVRQIVIRRDRATDPSP